MSGKVLVRMESPKTQSIDSVKSLLAFIGRASDPLPSSVELAGGARLTKSNKGDCFYVTTPTACSCPAAAYNPGQVCKHRKALQDGATLSPSRAQAAAYQQRQREARAQAKAGLVQQMDSIRPDMAGFRPTFEAEGAA